MQTTDDQMSPEDSAYVEPMRLGRISDGVNKYFVEASMRIEHREEEIPQQINEGDTSGFAQVWPTTMVFKVKLQCGLDRIGDDKMQVDPVQKWNLVLPAKDHAESRRMFNDHYEVMFEPAPVRISSTDQGIPEIELKISIDYSNDRDEQQLLKRFLKDCRLHYLEMKTFCRHFARSNTLMIESEDENHQFVADYIEKLHSLK